MKLVQIFLPLYDSSGKSFPAIVYVETRTALTEKFGGITTYTRSPAVGLWKEEADKTVRDEIITYEIMTEDLDKAWWDGFKLTLKQVFQQDEIVLRSWSIETL